LNASNKNSYSFYAFPSLPSRWLPSRHSSQVNFGEHQSSISIKQLVSCTAGISCFASIDDDDERKNEKLFMFALTRSFSLLFLLLLFHSIKAKNRKYSSKKKEQKIR